MLPWWTQKEQQEDCSPLYCQPAITETVGEHNPVQKYSVVTGVAATSKEQLGKSLLVTGRIEHNDSTPQAIISCLHNPVQKCSVVTGVAATSKEQLGKSLLVTGRIEHNDSTPQAIISLKTSENFQFLGI